MNVLSCKSKKGIDAFNFDISNYEKDFCYVIDGATPLFNDNLLFSTSDLYEYMKLLKKNIKNSDNIENSFIEAIKKSNEEIINISEFREFELPTYTIAGVKEDNKNYYLYVLCDTMISILYKNGEIENIYDDRFDKFKEKWKKENEYIDKLSISDVEKRRLKLPIWKECRTYANKSNGYPVGSTDYNSIKNGIIKKVSKNEVERILVCTDGFYNAFGIPNERWYFESEIIDTKLNNTKYLGDITYILISNNV